MITMTSYGVNGTTYAGLSLDSKPTEGVSNGSVFIEMNTGKIYFYDAENAEWLEWGSSADGGGASV